MKTTLTLLTAAMIVGLGSTLAIARPDPAQFSMKPAKVADSGYKGCCSTKTKYVSKTNGRGLDVVSQILCNTGCEAPRAGANCSNAERKQCAR